MSLLHQRLTVKLIEDRGAFDALEVAWRALDAHPAVRVFQEFEWTASWVRTLGAAGGWRLKIATLWQEERLVGVLPLCVRRFKGLRILEWIAVRVSDYCDAILDPRLDPAQALPTLWEAVTRSGGFDVARLQPNRRAGLLESLAGAALILDCVVLTAHGRSGPSRGEFRPQFGLRLLKCL